MEVSIDDRAELEWLRKINKIWGKTVGFIGGGRINSAIIEGLSRTK
jgi:uncharacterized protein with ACT and thioredoxin-like domain